jgi:Na+/H+ antiporter NhaC
MNNNNVKNYKTFLYWDDQNKLTKKSNSKKIIKLGIHTILVFILAIIMFAFAHKQNNFENNKTCLDLWDDYLYCNDYLYWGDQNKSTRKSNSKIEIYISILIFILTIIIFTLVNYYFDICKL